ncbi:MAG: formylglycine-generating enzyme family protein [Deltaproteobacteria bacterium]|jgi:formylglycine-generating enzyme required for sulfatase activity|nr:formylglycine-generating enzyme family protein [Deltaproteobacteria bacterium]
MSKLWIWPIIILALALTPSATAQLMTKAGANKPEFAYNPKPDAADIILPMPCDLKMVFKAVSLPVNGHLDDMKTRLGAELEENNPNGFFDRKYTTYLGSALSLNDLPPDQKEIAAKSLMNPTSQKVYGDQIFLIGKYEVTNAQFDAVMKGCAPNSAQSALPKTNISWYDALSFTEKYMTFLLTKHPKSLPTFPDDDRFVGLIRLPTDAEWEYAARGGHFVASEDLENEALFPLNGREPSAYGLFYNNVSQNSSPSRIGSLAPNPLGIYDTMGNVSEMTLDLFKMTKGSRLHGAATGGFIKKGGSYHSELADALPGRRQEVALFNRQGPSKAEDMGFRLALSSVAVSSASRVKQLAEEWREMGKTPMLEAGSNPLEKLDNLIRKADSPEEKATFESLRADFQDFNIAVQKEKAASIRGHCKGLIHTAYSIRNTGRRRQMAEHNLKAISRRIEDFSGKIRSLPANERPTANKVLNDMKNNAALLEEDMAVFDLAIANQFGYYKISIKDSTEFDRTTLEDQLEFVFNDIKGDDIYSQEMRKFYGIVVDHIKFSINGDDRNIKLQDLL